MAGRPRKRPVEESLDLALELFWRRGYEATSIQDLSKALGVGPSSLYNAFGSKEELYRRCVERYIGRKDNFLSQALELEDVGESLRTTLQRATQEYTSCSTQRGCTVMASRRVDHPDSQGVDGFMVARRAQALDMLRARITRGVEEGQFTVEVDVDGLARFVMAMLHGLSGQACDGADQAALEASIQPVLQILNSMTLQPPSSPKARNQG